MSGWQAITRKVYYLNGTNNDISCDNGCPLDYIIMDTLGVTMKTIFFVGIVVY